MTPDPPDDLNPYRSPQSEIMAAGVCEVSGNPAVPLDVALIKSAVLYRHVRFSGRLNADIRWNANGLIEYVSVNGRRVVGERAYGGHIPGFSFEIHSNGSRHTVAVENCVRWIYFTRAFRISVDGQAAYSEGDCSGLDSGPAWHVGSAESPSA